MGNQSDGQLLILLIIPVLWLSGLWVHSIFNSNAHLFTLTDYF